jgi:hypothetical protein
MYTEREIKLLERRKVHVVGWYDREVGIPSSWVERTGDGRFEAVVLCLVERAQASALERTRPDEDNEAHEHSLGIFDSVEAAIIPLKAHEAREENIFRDSIKSLQAAWAAMGLSESSFFSPPKPSNVVPFARR